MYIIFYGMHQRTQYVIGAYKLYYFLYIINLYIFIQNINWYVYTYIKGKGNNEVKLPCMEMLFKKNHRPINPITRYMKPYFEVLVNGSKSQLLSKL